MLPKVGPTLRDEQMRKEGKKKNCLLEDKIIFITNNYNKLMT